MGQKSNVLTIKTNNEYLNSRTLNSKEFWESAEFIDTFKRSLEKKGVTVTYSKFNSVAKTSYLSLDLFYKTQKLLKYKKKAIRKFLKNKKNINKTGKINKTRNRNVNKDRNVNKKMKIRMAKNPTKLLKNMQRNSLTTQEQGTTEKEIALIRRLGRKKFSRFLKPSNKTNKKNKNGKNNKKQATKKQKRMKRKIILKNKRKFNIMKSIFKHLIKNELVVLKLRLLNKKSDKNIKAHLLNNLEKFKRRLFSRRFNLFFDIVKLSDLFMRKKINLNAYTIALGTVFKFLPKNSHGIFFGFTKKLLNSLMALPGSKLKGIKVNINGKLKGKLRSSSFTMSVGKIDSQKISADTGFSKVHIHTLYGCFGLKMWVNYKKNNYVIRT